MEPISAYGVLILVAGLQLKHLVFDGPLQTRWMLSDKGNYGALGGLAHSGAHALGDLFVLMVLGIAPFWSVLLALAEGVAHYHIDFLKESFVRQRKLTAIDRNFWWALALDQALHQLSYIAMVAVLVAVGG